MHGVTRAGVGGWVGIPLSKVTTYICIHIYAPASCVMYEHGGMYIYIIM